MKQITFFFFFLAITMSGFSQKYITQTGTIKFFSEAPLENIEAINNQVSSVVNAENGDMAFSLLMKAFTFEKALMQEHFNEKYIESDQFPKATFKGSIEKFDASALTNKETEVTITGKLTIHGETNDVIAKGTLFKNDKGIIVGHSVFTINLAAYKINIPSAVSDNIASSIEITVDLNYEKL